MLVTTWFSLLGLVAGTPIAVGRALVAVAAGMSSLSLAWIRRRLLTHVVTGFQAVDSRPVAYRQSPM